MAMGPNVISEIVSEKTAAGIWKRLENLYLKKTLTNRLLLMRSCLFFKMKEGTTIQAHMTEFEDTIMKLKATDSIFATDNEALALILLYSLPERYSQFTNSFIYGRDSISLSDVKAGMICEEQRIQMKIGNSSRDNNSQGLFAERDQDDQHCRGRSRGRSQSRKPGHRGKSKQRGNCNYCHKPGHWVRDCPNLKNKGKDKAESSAVATEEDTGFSATGTPPKGDRRWVLDTGASCHMTPFRDYFTTFEKFEGNHIYMGNDTSCVTQGIGSVRIKMFDGSIRTLLNVKYVPSMSRSLISLGLLSRLGCKVQFEDENMRISRGNLIVMIER